MINNKRDGDWMQTWPAGRFWPLDPRPGEVSLAAIAHHLSMICRFGGAVRGFYSVAQHSVVCSYVMERTPLGRRCKLAVQWALLHDAAEAYVGDMIRPVKRWVRYSYGSGSDVPAAFVESQIDRAVADRFGLDFVGIQALHKHVKAVDDRVCLAERRDLLVPSGLSWSGWTKERPIKETIIPWDCTHDAERRFLGRAKELGVSD